MKLHIHEMLERAWETVVVTKAFSTSTVSTISKTDLHN